MVNSDIKFIKPTPANKIQKISKAVIRSSPSNIKYDFRNNNNTSFYSKYAGHVGGKKSTTNKNSSQRKIGEGKSLHIEENIGNLQYNHHTYWQKNDILQNFKKISGILSINHLPTRE